MPIGMPGWPEAAASTASMASARMALARDLWSPGERAAPRAGCLDVMAPVAGVGGRAGWSRRLGGAENAGAGEARQGGYLHDLRGGRPPLRAAIGRPGASPRCLR